MDNTLANIPPEVISYLDNLLREANITPVDETMREQLLLELYARLDSFITTTIVENMDPQNLDAFIKLNEENHPREEIEAFIKEKMPDADQVFAKAFIDFRDLYLGNTGVEVPQTENPSTN
ncbi:MAG: hypothetical protein PHQ59_04375 [Candidatus Daviesbacteria bacterium]|nr:hypothetical protein [Candidatus Daviesbacteria bacterium]